MVENEAAKVAIVAMDPPSNVTALQPNLLHAVPEITEITENNTEPRIEAVRERAYRFKLEC